MPALHARTPPPVVASARHGPSNGCALRLARGCFGVPLQSLCRAFEASTMTALRRRLRRGSTWVNRSISFRAREPRLSEDTD